MTTIEMHTNFNLKFENIYKTIVIALRANRSHPDVKRDWKWITYFVLAHGTFFLMFCAIMFSTIFYEIKNKHFTQACANGVLVIMFNIITLKYIVLVAYQKTIKEILFKIDMDYEKAKSFTKQEQDIILNYVRKGKFIVKGWTSFALTVSFLFLIKSVASMVYYGIIGEFKLVHAYDIHYPTFIDEKKNEIPMFIFLYTLFVYYDIYTTIMYIGFVPLVPIFVFHACGQIEVVTARLFKLFESDHPDLDVVQRKIKDIIIYIQDIHNFVEKIRYSMIFFYELLLKVTVIFMPVTGYQIMKSLQNGDCRIEFISVFIGTVIEGGMICELGDILLESSEKMRQAVYACGWETQPHASTRKMIRMLLLRTSRPVALNTLFRVVSRDLLTDMYHHSYAIFNLMNAMWD